MILSDTTIRQYIADGKIKVFPMLDMKNIRPVGIRMHLGDTLLIPGPYQSVDIDCSSDPKYTTVTIGPEGYILKPMQFVLGTTFEKFQVPRDIVCHIDGRSTVARLGLAIHCTSGIVDGNFDEPRSVVLEIKNIGNFDLILKPKAAIAMVTFTKLTEPIAQDSQQQYKGQDGVVAPNLKLQKQ